MPDPATPAAGAPSAAPPVTDPPAAPAPASAALTPEALTKRLSEAQAAAERKLLASFGAEKADDLTAKLKKLADLEAAQLTEGERTAKQIAEATKAAELGKVHATVAEQAVAELFEALSPAARAAITELGPKSPAELLSHIKTYRALSAAAQAEAKGTAPTTPATPPAAAPTTTTPTLNAPKPGGKTPFEVYSDMKARNDPAATLYYSMQRRAIEAGRPAAS